MQNEDTEALLKEGNSHLDNNDMEAAKTCFENATKAAPDCAEAWLMLGSILGELGNLEGAASRLEKAVELDAGDNRAQIALGQVQNALGHTDAATACFNQALSNDPEDTLARCALGELEFQSGNVESSIHHYEQATKSNQVPEQVWAMLGYLYLQKNDLPRAEQFYRTAVSIDKDNTAAITGWCTILPQLSRPDEADGLLNELLDSNPEDPEIHFQLAIAHSKLGRHAEATACADKALDASPDSERFQLGKADILERKGDLPGSFELLKPYLESPTPNPGAIFIFARFSHIVGLKNECLSMLQSMLQMEGLPPDIRTEASSAVDWVNRAQIGGQAPAAS